MIKEIAKSLSIINDKKYNKCFMAKATVKILENDTDIERYEVNVQRENKKISIINSKGYFKDKVIIDLIVYLIKENEKKTSMITKSKLVEDKKSVIYLKKFTKEEVYDFSKDTGDINEIHLMDTPIVQGLNILMSLGKFPTDIKLIEIKFMNPIYSDQEIHISKLENTITGYCQNKICFKVKFKELIN